MGLSPIPTRVALHICLMLKNAPHSRRAVTFFEKIELNRLENMVIQTNALLTPAETLHTHLICRRGETR